MTWELTPADTDDDEEEPLLLPLPPFLLGKGMTSSDLSVSVGAVESSQFCFELSEFPPIGCLFVAADSLKRL